MGTFTRMALRTVVILCLVLISITLTLSSNRVNRKETVEDDYDLESSREKSKHGGGSKHDNRSKRGRKKLRLKQKSNDYEMDMYPDLPNGNDYEMDMFPDLPKGNDYQNSNKKVPAMKANDYLDLDANYPSQEAK